MVERSFIYLPSKFVLRIFLVLTFLSFIQFNRYLFNFVFRNNCKETITSPGFSFRIAQRVRDVRPTTPNVDLSNLSTSYTLE